MSANRLQIFFLRKMLSRKRKRARVAPPWLGKRELIRHNGKDVEVFVLSEADRAKRFARDV